MLPGVVGAWLAVNLAAISGPAAFSDRRGGAGAGLIALVAFWWKAKPVHGRAAGQAHAGGAGPVAAKDALHAVSVSAELLAFAGVLQWAEGILRMAGFFALVLLSHMLFFGGIAFTRFGDCFTTPPRRTAAPACWGQWELVPRRQRRAKTFSYPSGLLETIVVESAWLDSRDTRALLVKDMRMFWRDTTQWGQSVMLFGLLGVYIINLRNFTHQLTSPFWINLVAYLNLAACSLNLATLTTRFVFPQFSLEGQRLWIVGMCADGTGARRQDQILARQPAPRWSSRSASSCFRAAC